MLDQTHRDAVLAEFEGFYEALDLAIEAEDADRIAALVELRAPVVAELAQCSASAPLPLAVRERIDASEQALRARMVTLYDTIFHALSAQRQRSRAVTRYACSG